MGKELEGPKQGLNAKIHLDSLRVTLKEIANWKNPALIDYIEKRRKKTANSHKRQYWKQVDQKSKITKKTK